MSNVKNEMKKIETETCAINWHEKERILYSVYKPGTIETLEMAKKNVKACQKLAGAPPFTLCVDISKMRQITRDAREYYSTGIDEPQPERVALLTGSKVSQLIGNFFIGLGKTSSPTRLFTSKEKAFNWLRELNLTETSQR